MTAHGIVGMSTQRIRYDQIAQVLVRTHIIFADLIIETKGGATLTVQGLGKAAAWEAQEFVKGRADAALDAASDTAAPQSNIPEQIEQLARLKDAGILTEAEFAEKKAELLKRL
jgi:predicted metal-dependent TIM-barrel fold hydrolase